MEKKANTMLELLQNNKIKVWLKNTFSGHINSAFRLPRQLINIFKMIFKYIEGESPFLFCK